MILWLIMIWVFGWLNATQTHALTKAQKFLQLSYQECLMTPSNSPSIRILQIHWTCTISSWPLISEQRITRKSITQSKVSLTIPRVLLNKLEEWFQVFLLVREKIIFRKIYKIITWVYKLPKLFKNSFKVKFIIARNLLMRSLAIPTMKRCGPK